MKATKFRIKNYKSIVDSGDCYFADKFTILAGKNESGKTSILEALANLHEDNKIALDKKPIGKNDAISTILISFELTKDDIEEIAKAINTELKPTKEKIKLDIQKSSDTNQYSIQNIDGLTFEPAKTTSEIIEEIKEKLKNIPVNLTPEFTNNDIDSIKQKILQWLPQNQFINTNGSWQTMNPQDRIVFMEVQTLLNEKQLSQEEKFIEEFIKTKFPYFILFSSFEDVFPDSIEIAKLKENEWANDLQEISKFCIEKISHTDKQTQSNHQSETNIEFSEKFNQYWTQDKIRLEVEKDGNQIYFWIVENGKKYTPSQRSKGQQWYLSFYIKIIARISENRPNVILIDEPGLYLHAKAQKDILRVLDEQNFEYPVVFSTHSPYLITEDKLGDVRLVEKTNGETKIVNKVWSKVSDGETLTPILTAIGLGINDSITNLEQKNNIVAEGMEETFYLRAFYKLCSNSKKIAINIINGGGTTHMSKIGAILNGWGCQVIYVLDNDKAGEKGKKS